MARKRKGLPINGILVLNKPKGFSSNGALQRVKHLFFAAKAGHTGSLDPLATGVLPLCFGEATKYSQYLLDSDKAYRTTITLGVATETGDAEGEVIETNDAAQITSVMLGQALEQFQGEISQVPSMYSALKHQGQPLYKLAREGKTVERAARKVMIYDLELLDYRPGEKGEVDLAIQCSKGTYIRSIAEDLGKVLGCGAHVSALHRTQAGPYREEDMVDLKTLEKLQEEQNPEQLNDLLLPTTSAISHLPEVILTEATGFYVRQGQPVMVPNSPTSGLTQLVMESGEFIGVGEILDDGRVAPRRLIAGQ